MTGLAMLVAAVVIMLVAWFYRGASVKLQSAALAIAPALIAAAILSWVAEGVEWNIAHAVLLPVLGIVSILGMISFIFTRGKSAVAS